MNLSADEKYMFFIEYFHFCDGKSSMFSHKNCQHIIYATT